MSLSFNARQGLIVTRSVLTGPRRRVVANLAIDTGSIMTLVNRRLVQDIGYDLSKAWERVQITTGSGVEFAPEITLSRIQALEQEKYHFPVLSHTLPPSATVDGVLGLDFLRGKRLVLDFRAGLITLD